MCKLGTLCVSVCPHVTIIAGVLALRVTARQQNNSVPPPFLLLLPPCWFSSPSLLYSVPSLAPHSLPSSHLDQLYLTSSLSFLSTPILSLLSLPPTFPHYADTLDFPVGNVNPSGQLLGNPELSLFSPLCTGSGHLPWRDIRCNPLCCDQVLGFSDLLRQYISLTRNCSPSGVNLSKGNYILAHLFNHVSWVSPKAANRRPKESKSCSFNVDLFEQCFTSRTLYFLTVETAAVLTRPPTISYVTADIFPICHIWPSAAGWLMMDYAFFDICFKVSTAELCYTSLNNNTI